MPLSALWMGRILSLSSPPPEERECQASYRVFTEFELIGKIIRIPMLKAEMSINDNASKNEYQFGHINGLSAVHLAPTV